MTVTIELEGQTIGEASFVPSYREVHPNGEDCPPTCELAEEQMTLRLP